MNNLRMLKDLKVETMIYNFIYFYSVDAATSAWSLPRVPRAVNGTGNLSLLDDVVVSTATVTVAADTTVGSPAM